MLSNMKIFITEQQKAELERLHDSSRDGRVRDRIKAILLASEGWSSAMIAQALVSVQPEPSGQNLTN